MNQVWRCGYNETGQFFVTPDRLANNDTALTGNIDGLDITGDVLWVAYNGDGSLKRTNDAASFTTTSILETETFRSGNTEKAKSASIHTEPLPSGATVILKYRVDHNTAWSTAVGTASTLNQMRIDFNADQFIATGSGAQGKEWHFRLESLNGAVITGFEAETVPIKDGKVS